MSKVLIALSLFLCLQFVCVCTDHTPVLLWGANSSSKPTLTLIRQNEFADLMMPLFDQAAVVAFLEPNLTSMDFMCRNTTTGNSCYTYMESAMPRTYYARVQNPVDALKAIASQVMIRSVDAVSRLETPISCETGKLTIISFNQSGIERNRHLQSHDSMIASITRMVKCPIVYIYTSMQNSIPNAVVRRSRHATIKKKKIQEFGTLLRDPLFVIFFKNVTLDENQNRTYIKLNTMTVKKTGFKLSIKLSAGSTELNKTDSKPSVELETDSKDLNQTESKDIVQLDSDSEELNKTESKPSVDLDTDLEEFNQTASYRGVQLDANTEELNKTDSKFSSKRSTDSQELNENNSKENVELGTDSQELNETNSKDGVELGTDSQELNETNSKENVELGTDSQELNETNSKESVQLGTDSQELNATNSKDSVELGTDSQELNETDSKDEVELGTELSFDVLIDNGYYVINEFVFRGVNYRAFEVETPIQMSYFCGNLELRSNNTKLIWHSLQFQGGHGKFDPKKQFKFYDAWHCVGFFTPPILSGIFVMILLIYITSIGVCWIMDITSNDRFEDPSKEPIKISFEE